MKRYNQEVAIHISKDFIKGEEHTAAFNKAIREFVANMEDPNQPPRPAYDRREQAFETLSGAKVWYEMKERTILNEEEE